MDVYRTERPFAAKLSSLVHGLKLPAQNIAFFYKDSTNLLFYLGVKGPVTVLADDKAAEKFLASDIGDKIVLSQERYMEKLLPLLPEGIRESPFVVQDKFPWEEQRPSKSNKLCAWVIMDPAMKDREAAEKGESSQNKENGK